MYWRICLQGFFFWLAYDLSRFPVIPLLAKDLGLSPEAIGLAVAASTITGIFGKSIAGGLSDPLGRRILMVIATVVAVVLPTLYFLADSLASLVVLRLFHGFATAIMAPVGRAFISDIVPANVRGNRLSTYTASGNLGTMAGRSLGGFLLFWGGYFYPFAASAVAGLLALLITLKCPKDQIERPHLKAVFQQMARGFREVGSNLVIMTTSFVEAVQYLTMGVVDAFLPIYAKVTAGFADWQIGLLYGIQMGTTILTKPLMGWLSDRWGRRRQIIVGLVLGGLILWRIPWETSFLSLALLVVAFGLAVSLTTSATSALVTDVCQREHYGAAHGVFGTILDIGHAAGPITAGFLITGLGYSQSFALYAALLILSSLLFAILVRSDKERAHA